MSDVNADAVLTTGEGVYAQEPQPPDWAGQLQLLIIQPTPFCNLDCDYCYLPNRDDRSRMDLGTLEAAAWKIFSGRLPAPSFSVVWHAGEPLAVPRRWYVEAFEKLARHCPPSVELVHHVQTNGVLIDAGWLALFREHGVRVGVSIDGPASLHDRHRRTRDGRGTHARVMQGIEVLRQAGFPFHVICVLTRESLDCPDEIFDFFAALGPTQLCFNIEEIEAANTRSSLAADNAGTERAYRAFMARIVERLQHASTGATRWEADQYSESIKPGNGSRMGVREIDSVLAALRAPSFGRHAGNTQNNPGQIISIACDGRFSTFSPELLGLTAPGIGDFALGNVLFDPLPPDPGDSRYLRQWHAVRKGVDLCRGSCAYFNFCLGGAPSNKLGETGRLDSSETMFCRLTQKATVDVVLEALDRDLPRVDGSLQGARSPV